MQTEPQNEYYAELPLPPQPEVPVYVPTPSDPPWGAWMAIGVWLASIFFIVVFPTVFILPYLATLHPPMTDGPQLVEFAKSDPTAVLLQLAAVIPAHVMTLLLAWLVVTKGRKYSFRTTLGWNSGGGAGVWLSFPLIMIAFFAISGVVSHYVPEQENDLIRMVQSSRAAVYLVAFMATFTAPIVEEVVYRGVLFSAFQRLLGVPAGFVLVTFLFALVHVPQYYPSWSTISLLFLLSLTLTAIRVRTKNLLPCIILHTLFNGIQSLFLLAEPWLKTFDTPDPPGVVLHFFK